MEILLKEVNELAEGVFAIYYNGKNPRCISAEMLQDYEVLGREIQMVIEQNNDLDIKLFDTILSFLNDFIGVKHFRPKSVSITIEKNLGNTIDINVLKYVGGMSAGGFASTDTTYNIYNRLDKIKKSMEDAIVWLNSDEETYT